MKTMCSFCGKSHEEVRKLIAGPGVYICDSCINVCKDILDKELSGDAVKAGTTRNMSTEPSKDLPPFHAVRAVRTISGRSPDGCDPDRLINAYLSDGWILLLVTHGSDNAPSFILGWNGETNPPYRLQTALRARDIDVTVRCYTSDSEAIIVGTEDQVSAARAFCQAQIPPISVVYNIVEDE